MLHQPDFAPPKHASQKTEGCHLLDPEITAPHHQSVAVLTEQSLASVNKADELAHRIAQQCNCLPSASWSTCTGCNTQALATTIATVQTARKAFTVLAQGLVPCFRMPGDYPRKFSCLTSVGFHKPCENKVSCNC